MNRHLSPWWLRMVCTASLLVPVLAQAQSSYEDSYIDTDMKYSGGIISFNSTFDPVIFSVGFGYRF